MRRILCLLLLVAGCRAAPEPALPGATALTPAQAVAVIERRERETQTLTAVFRLVLHKPDGSREATRGALVVARPDRLRLQIFSAGVMTVYDYTVNGERYRVSRPLEGAPRTGRLDEPEPGDEAVLRYDLRPLFLRGEERALARVVDAGRTYRATFGAGGARREVEVSKSDGRIESETIYVGGEPTLRARYSDYRSVEGAPLPFRIEVNYPAQSVMLEIEISGCTRNEPADPKLFEIR